MTDDRTPPDEPSALAAEYALGLLESTEQAHARRLAASNADFRAEVERWRGRLAPMLDQVEPVPPPANLWNRIEAATAAPPATSNVHVLQRKIAVWRGMAASMTALAASLALFALLRSPNPPSVVPAPQAASAPIVARVAADQKIALVASWDPQRGQLLLATAAGLPVQPSQSNELWVIPAGGKPRSLGVMPQSTHAVVRMPPAIATLMRAGATIAVTVEPLGGSPSGDPTGPVIASGALEAA